MKNMKKIGMTALAASLVSTSAFAGAVTVSGGASIVYNNYSGVSLNSASSWSMGNQLNFTGTGTLENGLNVTLAMEIDQAKGPASHSPFEAQSLTIARDDLGTLDFFGADASSSGSSISGTAAGNIWDNFDSAITGSVAGAKRLNGGGGDNSFLYTSPSFSGFSLNGSWTPHEAEAGVTGYGAKFTGVDGLSVAVARQDVDNLGTTADGDATSIKASYAFGPLTVSATDHDYKTGTGTASSVASGANVAQEVRSYNIAYTISENLSVNVGIEEIDAPVGENAEYQNIGASYTMGGMTLSAQMQEAENINYSTSATADQEYFTTSISFAF